MRKQPKQERSRQLVESIIQATAKAVQERGVSGLSTNYVAQLAGVSQGSLYQYFDSKEDLLEALLERSALDAGQQFRAILEVSDDVPVRQWMLAVVRLSVSILKSQDGLYLELVRHWHQLPTRSLADALQNQLIEASQYFILRNASGRATPDAPERLFICFNSALFTLIRMYSQDAPLVREEVVIQSLADMLAGYMEDVLQDVKL